MLSLIDLRNNKGIDRDYYRFIVAGSNGVSVWGKVTLTVSDFLRDGTLVMEGQAYLCYPHIIRMTKQRSLARKQCLAGLEGGVMRK